MSFFQTRRLMAASTARALELKHNLSQVQQAVRAAAQERQVTLVAVSKFKPASDVSGCYNLGQRDFGENYVQECVDKARSLPVDIRWHFIGPLQSNKAKTLAALPNLYAFHTLTSTKTAGLLSKHLHESREAPLKVYIQINTSSEQTKSGLEATSKDGHDSEAIKRLMELCRYVVTECPGLHLSGLMTIGSLVESHSEADNQDFRRLDTTRDALESAIARELPDADWGEPSEEGARRLALSMGMSSDFEEAIRQGSDVVRVGSSIFGERQ